MFCGVPLVDGGACQRGCRWGGKGRPTSHREGGRGLAGGAHSYRELWVAEREALVGLWLVVGVPEGRVWGTHLPLFHR